MRCCRASQLLGVLMVSDYFKPNLENMDLDDMWFQQDCTTSQTAHDTIDKIDERVISRNGPVNWPPCSYNLAPLAYFLWGCAKSVVHANQLTTLEELKANIEREIVSDWAEMCGRVNVNWVHLMNVLAVTI